MKIFKYEIRITDDDQVFEIPTSEDLPSGFKIIHIGLDPNDVPCFWAIVQPGGPIEKVYLRVFGTGHLLPDDALKLQFIGTFKQGPFMWHVFKVRNQSA